jgi:hypothetical protein
MNPLSEAMKFGLESLSNEDWTMLSFAIFLYSMVQAHLRISLAPGALLLPLIGFASCSTGLIVTGIFTTFVKCCCLQLGFLLWIKALIFHSSFGHSVKDGLELRPHTNCCYQQGNCGGALGTNGSHDEKWIAQEP